MTESISVAPNFNPWVRRIGGSCLPATWRRLRTNRSFANEGNHPNTNNAPRFSDRALIWRHSGNRNDLQIVFGPSSWSNQLVKPPTTICSIKRLTNRRPFIRSYAWLGLLSQAKKR